MGGAAWLRAGKGKDVLREVGDTGRVFQAFVSSALAYQTNSSFTEQESQTTTSDGAKGK